MSRPRIRTLKPENWSDEAVGHVSRDARLLRDVLITLADDDGRWRHLPSAIIGHGYPYDDDVTPARIKAWTAELVDAGLVVIYSAEGGEYGCFPRWHLHQVIPKYKESELPGCDDPKIVGRSDASRIKAGDVPAPSGSRTGQVREKANPRAQALVRSAPLPSLSDPAVVAGAPATTDPLDGVRDERLVETVAILRGCSRIRIDLEMQGVAGALTAHPASDHVKAAHRAVVIANAKDWTDIDAGRVLWMAFEDIDKRDRQINDIRVAGGKPAKSAPKPWAGSMARAMNDTTTEAA